MHRTASWTPSTTTHSDRSLYFGIVPCAIRHRPFPIQIGNDGDPTGFGYLVDGLSRNPGNFLSKNNAECDASTLKCDISDADTKLAERKAEASDLMVAAIAMILVLRDAY